MSSPGVPGRASPATPTIAALLLLGGCAQLLGIESTSRAQALATCSDGVENGDETGVDCGGACTPCAPPPASCLDGIQNGGETDIDCGGSDCPACAVGARCSTTSDCTTGLCTASKCVYAQSCRGLHEARPDLGDAAYTIDPDPSIQPFSIFCDMTTDGGGWTLVHKNNLASTMDRTDAGYNVGALVDPAIADVAVLPRDTIAAISPAREFRVLTTNGYKIYSLGGMPYYTTDHHSGTAYTGMMKYEWAAAYFPQATINPPAGNMHATMVCPASGGCTSNSSGLLATQRFCCGAPNAGFWLDGTGHFQPGYYAGAGWVR